MAYAPEDKLAIYAAATRGLMELEPDPERYELLSGGDQVFNDWAGRTKRFSTIAIQTPEHPLRGMQRCEN